MDYVQLFSTGRLYDLAGSLAEFLGKTGQATAQRLQSWDADELLNTPVDDAVEQLAELGSVDCPDLRVDDAYMLEPTEIDLQYRDWGEVRTRRVSRFVLVVPFDGDKDIFGLRPDQFTTMPPQVLRLQSQELHLAIDDPSNDAAAVKGAFDSQIANIQQYLGWSRRQIELHNQGLRSELRGMVERRREQLLATRNLQADIGFPVRRRKDADTYAAPISRKSVRSRPPRSSGARAAFKPEPTMRDGDYQSALRVLRNQRNALERSPSVVAKLDEEEIRDILLVGLNAQFEGDAGGELFNGAGKTDILIRVDDRNIFIGECKVWSGPKTMDDALKQLFGYLVWRDTKAAILLFIRNKDVTAVIDKAIAKITEHPNHKRSPAHQAGADQYEFTMHADGDPEREIHLALIPFAFRPTAATPAGT
ncbi:hypothetical protein BVU76_27000 [Mycolicibacterium porcinum]|nr:hypothetical protein BVU76_27000 [Mycolicibacterium porcinum]